MNFIYTSAINHVITEVMGHHYYLGSAVIQSSHAREHCLVEWLSVRLDLHVRPCSRRWGCGTGSNLTKAAKRTYIVTSQRGKRMIHPILAVSFGTNDRQLRYRRLLVT
jgi:hypothetical protein